MQYIYNTARISWTVCIWIYITLLLWFGWELYNENQDTLWCWWDNLLDLLGPVRMMLGEMNVVFPNLFKKSSTAPMHNNKYQYHVASINNDARKHTQTPIVLVATSSEELKKLIWFCFFVTIWITVYEMNDTCCPL